MRWNLKLLIALIFSCLLAISCAEKSKSTWTIGESTDSSTDPGFEEGTGPAPTYEITLPTLKRKIWVADEMAIRTISFTHDGDGAECSKDGGVTYIPCTSTSSFIWKAQNISVEHKIRFYRTDSQYAVYTFTPADLFPDISFVTCDSNLEGNLSFETFKENLNRESNRTLCLANRTYITNTGAESAMTLTRDNVTVIVRDGDTAIIDGITVSSVFDLAATSGFNLVGATVQLNSSSNARYAINANGGESIVLDSVIMENENTVGTDGARLVLLTSGSANSMLEINNSDLDAGSGVGVQVLASASSVEISDSVIVGKKAALVVMGEASVTDTTIGSNGSTSTSYPMLISGGQVAMSDSKIYDAAGNGAVYFATSSGILNIDNTTIRRTHSNGSSSNSVFLDGTGSAHAVNGSGNIYCNEGVNPHFTNVASSGFITGTAITGASIGTCPAE